MRLTGGVRPQAPLRRHAMRPANLLALCFATLLGLWLLLALAFLHGSALIALDTELARFMTQLWSPPGLAAFTRITALGDPAVASALFGLISFWALLRRRPGLVLGVLVAIIAELATVSMAKHGFARPRPEFGYFMETSGSFPSGHSAFGVAFYGMLFYSLWRLGQLRGFLAFALGAMTAVFVGLSRLYLVSHYLSDVLAGWVLGGMCLIVGIAAAQWFSRDTARLFRALPRWQWAFAWLLSLGLLGTAGLYDMRYSKPLRAAATANIVLAESTAPAERTEAPR
ncbi:phosphatase PAP2 family protein [Rhodobacter maris]|uniref:Membrane-associated phospholipid phosphatase n=1 Tax=Rhodobacter maris TaxID=446682 RepID=A0A285T0X4_9RHOB|nr:phosphatase PAP2 family protein [Rhodobacter maris]SOC14866.1 membrane-associated phospholipid phosphatase [Rhodobacter maris]